jgi:hypothetical protein
MGGSASQTKDHSAGVSVQRPAADNGLAAGQAEKNGRGFVKKPWPWGGLRQFSVSHAHTKIFFGGWVHSLPPVSTSVGEFGRGRWRHPPLFLPVSPVESLNVSACFQRE